MLEMIATLEAKGLAYRGSNGDVYYAVRSFPEYGRLSRRNLDDLRAGERVAVDAAKRDPLDFVLWKAAKPGEPRWSSMFGDGRPGWHIECSAMSCGELGAPFDIHGGGWDLQFPHHENEIAQSEGALGTRFVNLWMHSAFLNMDHEKMSKSLGNFFTTRDVLDRLDPVQGGEQLRFFLVRGHYRNEVNYTQESLDDAGNTLGSFYTTLREIAPGDVAPIDWSNSYAARFSDAMNDDFDTPIAFSVLHELRGEVNRTRSTALAGLLKALGGTIGLLQQDPEGFLQGGIDLDVQALIDERNAAKKAKNFARADEIRKHLESKGIVLEDKPSGVTEWRKK
jgi:cysteinyl-tRNA synthetase